MDKTTLIVFIVFAAIVAVSVLIQACVLAGVYFAGRKTQEKLHALVDDLRIHVLPALSTSRALLEDLSPKIKNIATNLVDSTGNLRDMADDVSDVVGDVADRARAQAAHVDGMVQGTLDHITQAGSTIQHGLSVPMRQVTGILNGLRAGINVMWQRTPSNHNESDRDLFV